MPKWMSARRHEYIYLSWATLGSQPSAVVYHS